MQSREPKLIYRLESSDSRGIYAAFNTQLFTYYNNERHPEPHSDGLLMREAQETGVGYPGREFYYGYESIRQLLNWWYEDRAIDAMAAEGVRLRIYKSEHYLIGNTQAVFIKSQAKLVADLCPIAIIDMRDKELKNVADLSEYLERRYSLVRSECAEPEPHGPSGRGVLQRSVSGVWRIRLCNEGRSGERVVADAVPRPAGRPTVRNVYVRSGEAGILTEPVVSDGCEGCVPDDAERPACSEYKVRYVAADPAVQAASGEY